MTLPIVERLRFRPQVWSGGRIVAESAEYLNPDGPEAAKLIEELVEALLSARNEIDEQLAIGFNAESFELLVEELDRVLAKIGGDS
jgi:hypothetical protein